MSYLSEELLRQIESTKSSVDDISEKCKISRGQIYKWLNAEQTSISAEQLDALSAALNKDPESNASLLVAHLQDERIGSARDLVRIMMDSRAELKDRPQLRTKGEKAIHFLAEERIIHRSVNDLVIDLARVLGAKI